MIVLRGLFYQLVPSVRPIDVTGCGLWATLDASPRGARDLSLVENGSTVRRRKSRQKRGIDLQTMALWATPKVSTGKYQYGKNRKKILNLEGQTAMISGKTDSGSIAPMEKKGSLNPQFSCWLMGFPKEWVSSLVQGMQSYRLSRQNLSKRS